MTKIHATCMDTCTRKTHDLYNPKSDYNQVFNYAYKWLTISKHYHWSAWRNIRASLNIQKLSLHFPCACAKRQNTSHKAWRKHVFLHACPGLCQYMLPAGKYACNLIVCACVRVLYTAFAANMQTHIERICVRASRLVVVL